MAAPGPQLATARLELRPFTRPDAAELLEIFRDVDVRRWLLDGAVLPLAWLNDEIAASDARFAASGAGLWSIRRSHASGPVAANEAQGPQPIIGFAGFREFFDPPQLQLLYGLLPSCWGQGLATEAARCVCDHAFDHLGFDVIAAATDIPNTASIAVMQRLGMRCVRRSDDGPAGAAFYAIGREAWLARGRR